MKLVRFGPAGKMVCIGTGVKGEDIWYSISDKVRPYLEKIAEGTEVTIKADKIKGTNTLLQIYPVNGNGNSHAASDAPTPAPAAGSGSPAPSNGRFPGKSPAEQDSIKRQAIGNMTSRALISLTGFVTPDNIEEITRKQYALYAELVG